MCPRRRRPSSGWPHCACCVGRCGRVVRRLRAVAGEVRGPIAGPSCSPRLPGLPSRVTECRARARTPLGGCRAQMFTKQLIWFPAPGSSTSGPGRGWRVAAVLGPGAGLGKRTSHSGDSPPPCVHFCRPWPRCRLVGSGPVHIAPHNPVIRTPGPGTRRGRCRRPKRGRRVRLVLTRRPRCPARGGWAELGAWVRPPGLPASRAAREGDGGGRRRHQRDGPFRLCRTPACGSERGGRALGRRSAAALRHGPPRGSSRGDGALPPRSLSAAGGPRAWPRGLLG